MSTSKTSRNLRDGVMIIRDGSIPQKVHTVVMSEGDLSWTETQNTNEIMDRGRLDHVRRGDDAPIDMSFTAKYVELHNESEVTLYDVLKRKGAASDWVNINGAGEDVPLFEMLFIVRNPNPAEDDEYISFTRFYHTQLNIREATPVNTISVTGRCSLIEPVVARS